MGVFTYETEATSVIPPVRLFKAFALDDDNLIPKVAPQTITNIEIVEGNGGTGTVKKITFGEGSQVKSVKQKVDAIDHANFTYGYTIIEADAFSDTLEKISYEIKMVASPDGGSILKSISHYHTKGDAEINEERVKADKEMASGFFKAVEAYLVAHPDEYK